MSVLALYAIRCDNCGTTHKTNQSRAVAARGEARTKGWTRPINQPGRNRMRIDTCPECSTANVNKAATA